MDHHRIKISWFGSNPQISPAPGPAQDNNPEAWCNFLFHKREYGQHGRMCCVALMSPWVLLSRKTYEGFTFILLLHLRAALSHHGLSPFGTWGSSALHVWHCNALGRSAPRHKKYSILFVTHRLQNNWRCSPFLLWMHLWNLLNIL